MHVTGYISDWQILSRKIGNLPEPLFLNKGQFEPWSQRINPELY